MFHREDQDGVRVLRLTHGKANALDLEFCRALARLFRELEKEGPEPVVLTAEGSIFSAGVDLRRFLDEDVAYVDVFLEALDDGFEAVWSAGVPVVAAANGPAIAGGCVLVQAADSRLMAEGTGRIGLPELPVGVPFPPLVLEILRSAVPTERLREVTLLGRLYEPSAARDLGLLDEVVAAEALLDRARECARKLGAAPVASYRATKQEILAPHRAWLREEGRALTESCRAVWRSEDTRNAIRAYVERTLS